MKKFLKYLGIILAVLIFCVVLAGIVLTTFISPNSFKPFIVDTVKNYTGRDISLEGDLSWTFFPSAGIKVKNIRLANPSEFKNPVFATIKEVTVLINLRPLLDKKIESNGVIIDGMQLNLIENAQGKNNWEITLPQNPSKTLKKTPTSTANSSSPLPYMVIIAGAQIKESSIIYTNEITKKTIKLQHLNLKATHFSLTAPFKFTAAFDYQSSNPDSFGRMDFKTDVSINLTNRNVTLNNMALNTKLQEIPVTVTGNMLIDLQMDRLQADNLKANADGLHAILNVRMAEISQNKQLVVKAQIEPVNLTQWLSKHHYVIGNLTGLSKVYGSLTITSGPEPLTVTGALNANAIGFNQWQMNHFKTNIKFNDKILHLMPFSAEFYQGTIAGSAEFNFNPTLPQISFNTTLRNINIGALPHNESRLKFAGKGDVDLAIKTFGLMPGDFKRNAKGRGNINIRQGMLLGFDIDYLLESALAFVKGQPSTLSNTGQTPFLKTTASFIIEKGMLSSQDFYLAANKFTVKGQGALDLVDEDINFQLQTYLNKVDANTKDGLQNLYGLAIPIKITGDLQNPKISLDKDILIKSFATQQFKKIQGDLQNKIKDKKTKDILNKLFGH